MISFVAARAVAYRELVSYRGVWWVFLSGFLEPVFYLFSIGVGVGGLIEGFEVGGRTIGYAEFVAPAMLAASAFNGALFDSTFNFFFKFKVDKLFSQQLATPLTVRDVAVGNLIWIVGRSLIYSAGFLAIMAAMGLVSSWWALATLPAALVIALAIAAIGMAATTWLRSFQDFEFITLAQMPMFLFSATFFPITAYPDALRWVVEVTPLYRGVVLMRELCLGTPTWASVVSVIYLLAVGLVGMRLVGARLEKLLLR